MFTALTKSILKVASRPGKPGGTERRKFLSKALSGLFLGAVGTLVIPKEALAVPCGGQCGTVGTYGSCPGTLDPSYGWQLMGDPCACEGCGTCSCPPNPQYWIYTFVVANFSNTGSNETCTWSGYVGQSTASSCLSTCPTCL
jgi:hypothetical protein